MDELQVEDQEGVPALVPVEGGSPSSNMNGFHHPLQNLFGSWCNMETSFSEKECLCLSECWPTGGELPWCSETLFLRLLSLRCRWHHSPNSGCCTLPPSVPPLVSYPWDLQHDSWWYWRDRRGQWLWFCRWSVQQRLWRVPHMEGWYSPWPWWRWCLVRLPVVWVLWQWSRQIWCNQRHAVRSVDGLLPVVWLAHCSRCYHNDGTVVRIMPSLCWRGWLLSNWRHWSVWVGFQYTEKDRAWDGLLSIWVSKWPWPWWRWCLVRLPVVWVLWQWSRQIWCNQRHAVRSVDGLLPVVWLAHCSRCYHNDGTGCGSCQAYAEGAGCCQTGGTGLCGSASSTLKRTEREMGFSLFGYPTSNLGILPLTSSSRVNSMSRWIELTWVVNTSYKESHRSAMVSSTYHLHLVIWDLNVSSFFTSNHSMNRLMTMGLTGDPMAAPSTCEYRTSS